MKIKTIAMPIVPLVMIVSHEADCYWDCSDDVKLIVVMTALHNTFQQHHMT